MKNRFLLFFLIFLCPLIVLQAQQKPIEPIIKPKWEVLYDKIPVTGEIRAGLLSELKSSPSIKKTFFVTVPKGDFKILHVEINSIDGTYHAELDYDISNVKHGLREFRWPTQYFKRLKDLKSSEITILCTIPQNSENEKLYFISSWVNSDLNNFFYVMLNSESPSKVSVVNLNTKKTREYSPTPLKNKSTVTYNSVCKLPVSILSPHYEIKVKQRTKIGGKIKFNYYPLNIKI